MLTDRELLSTAVEILSGLDELVDACLASTICTEVLPLAVSARDAQAAVAYRLAGAIAHKGQRCPVTLRELQTWVRYRDERRSADRDAAWRVERLVFESSCARKGHPASGETALSGGVS